MQVFRRLKRQGKTIIVVTHQERLMKIADRIMLIMDGRVEKVGKSEMILRELKGEDD